MAVVAYQRERCIWPKIKRIEYRNEMAEADRGEQHTGKAAVAIVDAAGDRQEPLFFRLAVRNNPEPRPKRQFRFMELEVLA
ncbi:hypothetical protein ABTA38_19410, partial [Acinetobacter baumannii]